MENIEQLDQRAQLTRHRFEFSISHLPALLADSFCRPPALGCVHFMTLCKYIGKTYFVISFQIFM